MGTASAYEADIHVFADCGGTDGDPDGGDYRPSPKSVPDIMMDEFDLVRIIYPALGVRNGLIQVPIIMSVEFITSTDISTTALSTRPSQ